MEKIPEIKILRKLCQATAPDPANESLVGRFSRIFSIYFTWLFLHTKITPNQMTILSTFVFFVGVIFFLANNLYWYLLGSLLIFFSIIFDGCDGEIARFRKKAGILGVTFVEPVSHDLQYGFLFLFFGLILFLKEGNPLFLFLGGISGIAKLEYRLLRLRFGDLVGNDIQNENRLKAQRHSLVRVFAWINKNFFSSCGLFLLILVFSVFERLDLFLWLTALANLLLWLLLFTFYIYRIKSFNYE